jgi:serine/threonine protein kinase
VNGDDIQHSQGEPGQMQESAATLEAGGEHLTHTAAHQPPHPSGISPMKFAYTTGARPLDNYTIKRGVGVGGFGEVYFATSDAGKEVALKRVQRNLDVEIRGVTQCLNLKHRNLISIFDIKYDEQGEAWIIMEFVNGESLKDAIDRHPRGMPLDEVRFWFTGIAAGVAYLHDHGIVHRDLKPGNIFLDDDVVKIGDYGLSKFISCSRRSGQTESVGTFHYMAPEIGKGVYGKEIDIYALGIMLCEMLTGHLPFEGESSQEIIMKHLTADPDLDGVPPRFRRVIERALFKDPAQRFANVDELLNALNLEGSADPAAAAARREKPPVIASPRDSEPVVYIDDEVATSDEIVFGPVVEIPQPERQSSATADGTTSTPEPIAAAAGASYHQVVNWWNTANISTSIKVVILVVVVLAVLANSSWLFPMAATLAVAYLIYFAIRAIMLNAKGAPVAENSAQRPPHHVRQAPAPRPVRKHRRRTPWDQAARAKLEQKPVTQRLAELTESFLVAALVCAVLVLILLVAGGYSLDGAVATWSKFAWLTMTTTFGAWTIIALAKFWEAGNGDAVLRRFVMMVAGLVLGLAAFAASGLLMIPLGQGEMFNVLELPRDLIPSSMYGTDGAPLPTAFMAFFGTLFLILRWWRPVDPLRKTRFSLWATAVCVFWAMLIPWQIPWGFVLAGVISVAVQLSATWMTPKERAQIRREILEAEA